MFAPRVLIGTSICIGTSVDCDNIRLVAQLGMPPRTIHLVQEMGRCGRNTSGEYETLLDFYHVILSLNDFVYLNKQLFY